ncbi:hypothetical protein [Streptomyces tardus]|uniref:hypothetical protein n=1 Tax=Streptomyces tardus TaxID=2780544 RepID=UPI0027E552A4|nr:hypothetical protein [Streptomyces tardus]
MVDQTVDPFSTLTVRSGDVLVEDRDGRLTVARETWQLPVSEADFSEAKSEAARFSHGVRKGNILQVAGQVGFLPAAEGVAPTPAGPGRSARAEWCEWRACRRSWGATWGRDLRRRARYGGGRRRPYRPETVRHSPAPAGTRRPATDMSGQRPLD